MNQMDEEKYLKTFKKDELIKFVIKLEEELAKCKTELGECEAEVKEKTTQLLEHQEYKKRSRNLDFWPC